MLCFSCAWLPNLFPPWPAERSQKRGRKRTSRIVKSATVHRDSLTGNAERFWPLVVTAGWTSTDKTREEVQLQLRRFLNCAFVLACFLSCDIWASDTTDSPQENIRTAPQREEDFFDELCCCRNNISKIERTALCSCSTALVWITCEESVSAYSGSLSYLKGQNSAPKPEVTPLLFSHRKPKKFGNFLSTSFPVLRLFKSKTLYFHLHHITSSSTAPTSQEWVWARTGSDQQITPLHGRNWLD